MASTLTVVGDTIHSTAHYGFCSELELHSYQTEHSVDVQHDDEHLSIAKIRTQLDEYQKRKAA